MRSDKEIEDAVRVLVEAQVQMTPEERLALRDSVFENYCEQCGREATGSTCYCMRDE